MARISGQNLSNVSAFTNMLSQVAMLGGYAVLLAVSNFSVRCTIFLCFIFNLLSSEALIPCVSYFGRNRGNQATLPVILECGA